MAGDAWWPWIVIACGAAVTYFWRFLGVLLAGHVRQDSAIFTWIGCVAYALLAGLITRMIVLPLGPLADTPLLARLAGAGCALAIFLLLRRNVLLGVVSGVAAMVVLTAYAAP
jgi:branched-subunit amino acid transport protein